MHTVHSAQWPVGLLTMLHMLFIIYILAYVLTTWCTSLVLAAYH